MAKKNIVTPSLRNPFGAGDQPAGAGTPRGPYEEAVEEGQQLRARPRTAAGLVQIGRQHAKDRMTVWERIDMLRDPGTEPTVLYQNWGPNLDGASIVTAIVRIKGRSVAVYGHDFTVRAGSMDATNGTKLANLIRLAGEQGLPLIGMNDSAGAFVPAGIGGLDGYAEAFTALRKISGVVPSIMCMFGYNAGGGSYLPRQGSFMIQPVPYVLRLDRARASSSPCSARTSRPTSSAGPACTVKAACRISRFSDEVGALRTASASAQLPCPETITNLAPYQETSDPIDRPTGRDRHAASTKRSIRRLASTRRSTSASSFSRSATTATTSSFSPSARGTPITAFGRLGGQVVGFVCNNSAVSSGQIDVDAAFKNSRFIRFCNLYNIPGDLLGRYDWLPAWVAIRRAAASCRRGGPCSTRSLICAHRALLLIIRNAFGGAYAAFNCYATGRRSRHGAPDDARRRHGPSRQGVRVQEGASRRSAVAVRVGACARGDRRRRLQRRCAIPKPPPGSRSRKPRSVRSLRKGAHEPEGGAEPRLDLRNRHAHQRSGGACQEPRLLSCPTTHPSRSPAVQREFH